MITEIPLPTYFDPSKPITFTVDTSSQDLGAAILHDNQRIAYASHSLRMAEQNYAQNEKAMLVVSFGCNRFQQYIDDYNVKVETDHKRLEAVFRKALYKARVRLQILLLSVQKYSLKVEYKPGKAKTPLQIEPYRHYRDEPAVEDGLPFKDYNVIVWQRKY